MRFAQLKMKNEIMKNMVSLRDISKIIPKEFLHFQLSTINFQFGFQLNYNLPHQDTLTDLRMAESAPFSNRDTCAWEIPNRAATSIWVLPS